MASSSEQAPRSSWPKQRRVILLREPGTAGIDAARTSHLLLATHIRSLLPAGYPAPLEDWCAAILQHGGASRRCLERHDGLHCAVEVLLMSSDIHGLVAVITVRDAADALLGEGWQSAEAMEVMVHTAGILAHKTNNTLTSVLGNAEYLTDMEELPVEAMQSAQLIMTAVEKLELQMRRIGRLSAASRPGSGHCDPALELDRIAEQLRPGLPREVALSVEASAGQGLLLVEPRALHQAINELVNNALTALAGQGRILLAAALRDEPAWAGFGWIALTVADDGSGIDLDLTSSSGKGLLGPARRGNTLPLGLPIVRAFALAMGGRLIAERPPQGGTRMVLRLPALLPGRECEILPATRPPGVDP